jgi:hypothetical protein
MPYMFKSEPFDQQLVLQLMLSEPQSIPESLVGPPDGQWPVKNSVEMRLEKSTVRLMSDIFEAV